MSLLTASCVSLAADEALAALLQELSTTGVVTIQGRSVFDLPLTQQLYAQSSQEKLWSAPSAEQLQRAIENAYHEGMDPADYHQPTLSTVLSEQSAPYPADTELLLSDSLLRLAAHYARGKIEADAYPSSWNFDRVLPPGNHGELIQRAIEQSAIPSLIDSLKPRVQSYSKLVGALQKYRDIEAAGGWQPVSTGPTLRIGDHDNRVKEIRRRLAVTGDLSAAAEGEAETFDTALEQAVIAFQRRHRIDADGIVGAGTLGAMNVGVAKRIGQIRVNLERARAINMVPENVVIADIAGYEVTLVRDGEAVLLSRAQVGKPYRRTPVFRHDISYVEFNPTWTVPPTILRRDVLPAIKGDPEYLKRKQMRVLTMAGEEVNAADIDWQRYPGESFPYMIRQDPGPHNALGRIKLMFPNHHMVYLHDTPSQALFAQSDRSFSSGCIRVEKVKEMAALLLDDPENWSLEDIDAVIASKKTRRVSLREPFPVILFYWTVDVEDNGEVHFKHDPYQRDALGIELLKKPFKFDAQSFEARRQVTGAGEN